MDFNEYAALMLVRERHAEMVAAARRDALVRRYTRRHRTFRAALGTTLIRAGAWLLREHYPTTRSEGASTALSEASPRSDGAGEAGARSAQSAA